jgi:hypothetical protein
MKVILFGATGMIGAGALLECLIDDRVQSVLSISRSPCGIRHPRLRELIRTDFTRYDDVKTELTGWDACFFCLGVSSAGMKEAEYQRITYDLTLATAETLGALNPGIKFIYVSGVHTDSTELGRVMWARVKGRTENRLLRMPRIKAYMFRPGLIQPLKGVRSKTRLYQVFYTIARPLFPLLKRLLPKQITTTENVGRAMIEVAARGYSTRILEIADINLLAHRA